MAYLEKNNPVAVNAVYCVILTLSVGRFKSGKRHKSWKKKRGKQEEKKKNERNIYFLKERERERDREREKKNGK